MNSRTRIVPLTIAALVVGFLALLFIVGMSLWLGARAQHFLDSAIEARNTRSAAAELRYAIQTAESSQRGYIATGNEIYLAPYSTAKALAKREFDTVEKLLSLRSDSQSALQKLKGIVADKFTEMDQTIALKKDRQDAEALAIIRTNRGKGLMDEANVFFSSIIRNADARLTDGANEQAENAALLRFVTIVSGFLIFAVVAGVFTTILRYTRDITLAGEELDALNAGLERRVAERTTELALARDRAEALLTEVNHRVANSLSLVGAMIGLQARSSSEQETRDVLEETQARIVAISLVHKLIYTTGDVRFVALDVYLTNLLGQLQAAMNVAGHAGILKSELQSIRLPTDASINLGVVVAEWVTNAFKYAYPGRAGEIRVRLKELDGTSGELSVEDDGIGRGEGDSTKGTGLGSRLVNSIARSMGGNVEYLEGNPGTSARLIFPLTT